MDKDCRETARWLGNRTTAALGFCWNRKQGTFRIISQALWGLILFDIRTSAPIGGWRSLVAKSASAKGRQEFLLFYFSTLEQMSMAAPQIQVLSPNPVTLLLPSPLAAHLCFRSKLGTIFTAMKFFILKAPFFFLFTKQASIEKEVSAFNCLRCRISQFHQEKGKAVTLRKLQVRCHKKPFRSMAVTLDYQYQLCLDMNYGFHSPESMSSHWSGTKSN